MPRTKKNIDVEVYACRDSTVYRYRLWRMYVICVGCCHDGRIRMKITDQNYTCAVAPSLSDRLQIKCAFGDWMGVCVCVFVFVCVCVCVFVCVCVCLLMCHLCRQYITCILFLLFRLHDYIHPHSRLVNFIMFLQCFDF